MKKHFSLPALLALLFVMLSSTAFADTVTIGTGTGSANYFPIYGTFDYSYTQQIYTQTQINFAGPITKIRFYYYSGDFTNSKDWVIFMGHTDKSSFDTGTDWIPLTNLTQVFAGDVSNMVPLESDWMEISLDTPFSYNNTDNLVIAVDENTPGNGYVGWGGFTSGTNKGIYYYDYEINPDPAAPPAAKSRSSNINRIQLVFPNTTAPLAPALMEPVNSGWATTDAVLKWQSLPTGADVNGYDVYFGASPNPPLVSRDQTDNFFIPTLDANNKYYWKVVAKNEIGDSPASDIWIFRTPGANNLVESFEDTDFPPLGWTNPGDWSRNPSYNVHGTASAYKRGYSSSQYILSTPKLTMTNDSSISFWSYVDTFIATLQVVYSEDRENWTQVGSDITHPTSNTWYNNVVDLSSLDGNSYYLGIRTGLQSSYYYIDMVIGPEITPEAPGAPTLSLPADEATDQCIVPTFTWTVPTIDGIPTGYKLYLDTVDGSTLFADNITGLSYVPTTLLDYDTTYYWKMSAFNASGEGPATPVRSFTTRDDPTIYSLPWTEDFEGSTFPPTNWTRLSGLYPTETPDTSTSGWWFANFANVATPANKSARLNILGTAIKYWLVTPPIAIPTSGYDLRFDLALTTSSGTNPVDPLQQLDDKFIVLISDNPKMINASVLRQWDNAGSPHVFNEIAYLGENQIIDLSAYPGTKYIAFYGESTVTDGNNNIYVDNVTISETPANPIFIYSPDVLDFGTLLQENPSDWQNVTVTNGGAGIINLDANNISFVGTNAAMFEFDATNLPVALGTGHSVKIPVRVTLTDEGDIWASLRMVHNSTNYDVDLFAVGWPAGTIFIGDGVSTTVNMPINPAFAYNYSQNIYLQSEIDMQDQRIEKIAYYWNGKNNGNNIKDWTVYMGHTYNETFASTTSWIPLGELTQVYSGTLSIPATAGWIFINLDNPFEYNNTQNLVIAVHETTPGNSGSTAKFLGTATTPGEYRGLRSQSNVLQPNPASPGTGTLAAGFANIMMQFEDMPAVPIFSYSPEALDFGEISQNATSAWRNVIVTNNGTGIINLRANDISIIGSDAAMFELDDQNLPAMLGQGVSVVIPVRVTATAEGDISAILRMVHNSTNYDVVLSAVGLPAGFFTIGEGSEISGFPFFSGYKAARTQMLFTVDELIAAGAVPGGSITHIAYDVILPNDIILNDLMIRFKHTDSINLTAFDQDNLDNCFQDNLAIQTAGWNYFDLQSPFIWNGTQNLLIDVSFTNNDWNEASYVRATAAAGKTWARFADGETGSTMTGGDAYANRPNTSFIMGPPASGTPAAPILTYPCDIAIGLSKYGFDLTWEADLNNGGMPTYYAVFMSQDEETIFEHFFFEVEDLFFNPIADSDGEIVFNYDERWYWTVTAGNIYGESVPAAIRSFQIEADPTTYSLPWCEGFEGSVFPPAGWTMVDDDGDGYNWFQYSYDPHTGNYSAATASWWDETSLSPDNWLITPPIAIPATGEYIVEYYVAGQDANYPDEHYGFYISTAGTDLQNFTLLREETLEDADWHQRTNPLLNYAGQTVHFAFRHFNSSDVFYMKIDDVCVREIPQAPMLSINPAEFNFGTTHVLTPTTPKTFTLSNIGLDTIDIGVGDIWLTDVEGNFVLDTQNLPVEISTTEPYSFTVQFIAQSAGFKSATLNIQDNITRAIHTVALTGEAVEEPIASVIMLEGELSCADAASLDWASIYGDPTQSGYLHWDDSIDRGAVGAGANQYHVAVMFGSEVMEHTVGQVLDGVMIHLNEEPQTVDYVKVWSGTDADIAPENLLTSQAVSGLTVGWNYIPLNTSIPTTGIEALWVGYHVNGIASTFPASTDGLSAIDGRGNLVELGGNWMTLVNAGISGNWLIHAHFTDEAEYLMTRRPATLNPKTVQAQVRSQERMRDLPLVATQTMEMDRVLRGFNIFRDNVQINTETVAAYYYTDENLAPGTYYYAVQSVHDSANGPISYTVPVTIPEPPAPFVLPFTEDWSAGMEENFWTAGGTNWDIIDDFGNPDPSIEFSWYPFVTDYNIPLTSYDFDATGLSNVHLSFDLLLDNYSFDAENNMAWEVWDGSTWNRIDERSSLDDSFDWTTLSYNISEYAANREFKIRFVAYGEDSYEINNWNIDNIMLYSLPESVNPVTDLSISISDTNIILDWTAVDGAQWYAIYASDDPYSGFDLIYVTETAGNLTVPANLLNYDKQFVRITAGAGEQPSLPLGRH